MTAKAAARYAPRCRSIWNVVELLMVASLIFLVKIPNKRTIEAHQFIQIPFSVFWFGERSLWYVARKPGEDGFQKRAIPGNGQSVACSPVAGIKAY